MDDKNLVMFSVMFKKMLRCKSKNPTDEMALDWYEATKHIPIDDVMVRLNEMIYENEYPTVASLLHGLLPDIGAQIEHLKETVSLYSAYDWKDAPEHVKAPIQAIGGYSAFNKMSDFDIEHRLTEYYKTENSKILMPTQKLLEKK